MAAPVVDIQGARGTRNNCVIRIAPRTICARPRCSTLEPRAPIARGLECRVMGSGATVLVVDDNGENRALAKATLEDDGYRVVLASGGEDGIAAFERERPDCVLLDVRMPETDGPAACGRMRALPGGHDVPIVFVTALRDVETFDRTVAAGGDDFLSKPFRPNELIARVEAALKLRKLAAERSGSTPRSNISATISSGCSSRKNSSSRSCVHDLKNPVNAIGLHAELRDPRSRRQRALEARRREDP